MARTHSQRRRPVLQAFGLTLGWGVVTLASYAAARSLMPQGDPQMAALVAIAMLAGVLAAGLAAGRLWAQVGFTLRAEWRDLWLLILPGALVFLPLCRGFAGIEPWGSAILALGYGLTGFAEEGFFRGVLLAVLAPYGALRAVVISSVLFGLAHLSNMVIRGQPEIILVQAIGAACFGFGYAAVRLRINTLWPLIGLHALTDLFLHIGALPLIAVAVVQDIVLLGLGVVVLMGRPFGRADLRDADDPGG